MIATVGAAGTLGLPFMAQARQASLLRRNGRLQDLESKGRTPRSYWTKGCSNPQRADLSARPAHLYDCDPCR